MPLDGDYEPSTIEVVRQHVDLYERSGGTDGTRIRGMPMVVVTSRGARSGKLRKNPVMRVEHGGRYAVVASKEGNAKHPEWYHNIVTDPHVQLQDGTVVMDMTARLVTSDERAIWWERAVEVYASYAAYQKKTSREIPIFVLEPHRP